MVENIFIKILIVIFIGVIIYIIYNYFYIKYLSNNQKCNLNNYNIDDLVIIKRTPEYSNLINDLINEKSFIFSDNQLKVLKNPQQIFSVFSDFSDINKQNLNISNISDTIYTNCKNQLENNTFDLDNTDKTENSYNNDKIEKFDNLIDVSNKEYTDITNKFKNDINSFIGPNYYNTGVLRHNNLNNYYQDLYGNKINADLSDYFTAYYTLINNNDNVDIPVNTLIGKSNFIIPDQYKYVNHLTNAYNIDYNRIINPITYS